jgi:DNA-binding transcriptional ArsR family regulator
MAKRGRPKGSKNRVMRASSPRIESGSRSSVVQAFLAERTNLENRRAELLAELQEINDVLGEQPFPQGRMHLVHGKRGVGLMGKGRVASNPVAGRASTSPAGKRPRGQVKELVLGQLSKGKPMTASPIAAATGLSPQQVSNTLSGLRESGRVKRAKSGKGFVLA